MYNTNFKGDVCSHTQWFFLDNVFRRMIQNPRRIVGPYLGHGDLVVDLGCGPGYFTIDMAKMVGESGRVIAVDLQKEMLAKVRQKAEREGLQKRIRLHNCSQERIGLDGVLADFVLAYYMVHETLDHKAFLGEIKTLLKPGGKFLLVEPIVHVSRKHFEAILKSAVDVGFRSVDSPGSKGGRSALLV